MDCYTRLKEHVEKAGLEIPEARLREMAVSLEAVRANVKTPAEFALSAQRMIEEDWTRSLAKKRAADAITLATREKAVRVVTDQSAGTSIAENMRSWLEGGSLKPGDSVNLDVRRMQHAVEADLRRTFRRGMEPYKDIAAHGSMDREVYQELWSLQKGLPVGQSGSQVASEIAKVVQGLQNQIFDLKKAFNPFLEKADEYLVKQFHAREKVSGVTREQWVQDAMKAYGSRSFPELTAAEKIPVFESIYERIRDGSFGSVVDDSVSDKFITVNGTGGNILRRMSRSRVLVAEDWKSAFEYNLKYGYGTIAETLDAVMRKSAKDISILNKFGPNPQGMYEGVYRRALSKAKPEERAEIEARKSSFDASFRTATGSTEAPARGQQAKLTQGALTLAYVAKAGGAWLRSLPDLAIASGLVRGLNGKTVTGNAFEIVGAYAKSLLNSNFRNEALESLWMFSRTANAELLNALGSAKAEPGAFARLAELQGKLSILNRHENAMRSAIGVVVSKELGNIAGLEHAKLPERWQQGLLRYGIGELEWNTLRRGLEDWKLEGRSGKLLNADSVEALPDELIENYLRKSGSLEGNANVDQLFLGRKQLAYKLGALINDHADFSASRPGTRQLTFLHQGTDINQPTGQLLRLLSQFKSATVVSADSYRRAYFSGEGLKGDWSGVAQQMAMSMFLWSVGEYSLQILSGKTPEAPDNPGFIAKMVAGSGAGGIFGDILVNEANRNGTRDMVLGALKSAAGPVIGDLAEGSAIALQYGKSLAGQKAPNAKAAQIALGLIPGQNLLWARGAFNFYFANGLKEFLGPGYLGTLERSTAQTPGLLEDRQRHFMFKPMESPVWPRSLVD